MSDDEPRYLEGHRRDGLQSGQDAFDVTQPPSQPPRTGRDVWRASASFGFLIGVSLLLLCGVGIVLLAMRLQSASGGQRIAWIAIAAALTALFVGIAFLLRAWPTMRYRFAGDALIVEWLGQRRVVPLAEISSIVFEPSEPLRLPRWEPFWPGYYVATVRAPDGVWHSWATQRPHRRVRLTTPQGIVAISPERPVRFIAELDHRRQSLGHPEITDHVVVDVGATSERERLSSERVTPRPRRSALADRPRPRTAHNPVVGNLIAYRDQFRERFLADPIASSMIAIGVILPVLMVAYLYSQYEGLPDQIPIHWDASGDVVEQTTPGGLWRFPRIAVIILVVNTAIGTLLIGIDRYLARLIVAGIPLVQLILFIALIRAVN